MLPSMSSWELRTPLPLGPQRQAAIKPRRTEGGGSCPDGASAVQGVSSLGNETDSEKEKTKQPTNRRPPLGLWSSKKSESRRPTCQMVHIAADYFWSVRPPPAGGDRGDDRGRVGIFTILGHRTPIPRATHLGIRSPPFQLPSSHSSLHQSNRSSSQSARRVQLRRPAQSV